jgi:hypothetical protein
MLFAKRPEAGVAPHKKQQAAFFQLPTDIFCHAAPTAGIRYVLFLRVYAMSRVMPHEM